MRVAGIVLVIIGILMVVFTGFDITEKKKLVDIGPLEVNKNENKHIGWPSYTGGTIAIVGVILIVAGGKAKS